MLTLSKPINILFLISQSAAGAGEEKTEMVIVVAVHEMGQFYILRLWNKNSKRRYLVKSWE